MILIVGRKEWKKCKDFEKVHKISGVIIVDDEKNECNSFQKWIHGPKKEDSSNLTRLKRYDRCYSYQTSDIR